MQKRSKKGGVFPEKSEKSVGTNLNRFRAGKPKFTAPRPGDVKTIVKVVTDEAGTSKPLMNQVSINQPLMNQVSINQSPQLLQAPKTKRRIPHGPRTKVQAVPEWCDGSEVESIEIGRYGLVNVRLRKDMLFCVYDLPSVYAAKVLKVSLTLLKKIRKWVGLLHWPCRQVYQGSFVMSKDEIVARRQYLIDFMTSRIDQTRFHYSMLPIMMNAASMAEGYTKLFHGKNSLASVSFPLLAKQAAPKKKSKADNKAADSAKANAFQAAMGKKLIPINGGQVESEPNVQLGNHSIKNVEVNELKIDSDFESEPASEPRELTCEELIQFSDSFFAD